MTLTKKHKHIAELISSLPLREQITLSLAVKDFIIQNEGLDEYNRLLSQCMYNIYS